MNAIIALGTAAVLAVYAHLLKWSWDAGTAWLFFPLCLVATFAVAYWMSPEDRPTFHRVARLWRRK